MHTIPPIKCVSRMQISGRDTEKHMQASGRDTGNTLP